MNGYPTTNSIDKQNQIPKNLPLKKRRAYIVDPTHHGQDENDFHHRKQSFSQEDSLQFHLPSSVTSTPPSSPHYELLRQQYAYFLANLTNNQTLLPPPNYDCLMAQKALAEQFMENYRTFLEQQQPNHPNGYTLVKDKQRRTNATIDEHFRKSLGDNYEKFTGGFLTPEDSSSNSSPTERAPVDSIDEHFARSLGRFWPLPASKNEPHTSSMTESVVDDHFAKALGATTWERLKEKS